jgi:hypothetical protein
VTNFYLKSVSRLVRHQRRSYGSDSVGSLPAAGLTSRAAASSQSSLNKTRMIKIKQVTFRMLINSVLEFVPHFWLTAHFHHIILMGIYEDKIILHVKLT